MPDEILIAEDDHDLRPLLERAFESEGYDVRAFADGADVLDYLGEGGRPAGILLDLMMPGVDGLEVLEELAVDEELAAIPVVMLTGYDGNEAVETALDRGASDYVTKPFSPSDLVARVEELLE